MEIDHFGQTLRLSCAVSEAELPAGSFLELVKKDAAESAGCARALAELADSLGLTGYARVLLAERLAAGLAGSGGGPARAASFADAVAHGGPLTREARLALTYALVSRLGFGIGVMRGRGGYFLVLRIDERITGNWWSPSDRYTWEPGRPFTDLGPAANVRNASEEVYREGRAVEFVFPDLDWGAGGSELRDFTSPPGCPAEWSRIVPRLPELERYLALWPRDRQVQTANAHRVLAEYGFDRTMSDHAGLADEALGTCVLQYTIFNFNYDWKRARDLATRNPAETLFVGGDCDELTYALAGLLRLAGFGADRIVALQWDPDRPDAHMNLGVAPLAGELASGSWVESGGRRYYVMDPSYQYTYNGELATAWGMLPKKYQGRKTEIFPVK